MKNPLAVSPFWRPGALGRLGSARRPAGAPGPAGAGLLVVVGAVLFGCGGASQEASAAPETPASQAARIRKLEQENRALAEKLEQAELAERMAQGRAPGCEEEPAAAPSEEEEAEDGRSERPVLAVVRLTPSGPAAPAKEAAPSAEEPRQRPTPPKVAAEERSRPVLRLHGDEPPRVVHLVDGDGSLGDGAASALPPSSPPSASPPSASARASSTTPAGGSAKEAYDEALALVRAREFQRAAEALRAFLENHPETPFSDNALYWLGECHYARGAYAEARKEFERLIERYPHENKVPDAWLKLGLSHDRQGNHEAAQRAFAQLRTSYPQAAATQRIPARYSKQEP